MKRRVTVSIEPPRVLLPGPRSFFDQWVEFYALLALQQQDDPDAFVTVSQVHRLRSWNSKKIETVGKEITRHVTQAGLADIIHSPARGKTKAWRLGVPASGVEFVPSSEGVRAWIDAHELDEEMDVAWIDEVVRLVRATVHLRKGNASDAREALERVGAAVREPALVAWRALAEGRADYLFADEDDLFEPTLDALARGADPAGRAVVARLRAYRAMTDRYIDAERTRAALTKVVADLELSGDIGSLGVMLNVLAVLERRAGAHAAALRHLARAVGLLGICGDYHTLQAVLYNASKAHESLLAQRGCPPDDRAYTLIDLCITLCREFHVGGDSALAEVTLADWSIDRADLDAAGSWLEQAGRILATSDSSYDHAYFLQTRARFAFARGEPMSAVTRDLRAASRIYGTIGDLRAQKKADALLAALARKCRS